MPMVHPPIEASCLRSVGDVDAVALNERDSTDLVLSIPHQLREVFETCFRRFVQIAKSG
jgi:hypothetical protein